MKIETNVRDDAQEFFDREVGDDKRLELNLLIGGGSSDGALPERSHL